jgi:hypothetical protein
MKKPKNEPPACCIFKRLEKMVETGENGMGHKKPVASGNGNKKKKLEIKSGVFHECRATTPD